VPHPSAKPATAALELKLLQFCCTQQVTAELSPKLRATFQTYAWHDPEHQIVLEALSRLASGLTPFQVREQLPAQATRMGFPDVDWQTYFQEDESESAHIEDVVRQLLVAK
jgi:hypothetical protein